VALGDAVPLYRDAAETRAQRRKGKRRLALFISEVLPDASAEQREVAADVVMTAMSTLGKAISERECSKAQVDAFAEASSDMFCAYLQQLHSKCAQP
jgi:hypothetical protein